MKCILSLLDQKGLIPEVSVPDQPAVMQEVKVTGTWEGGLFIPTPYPDAPPSTLPVIMWDADGDGY